ncbi:MAG: trigger factor [Muribaculaceae bacterium]|nr:trigger factor [Muribaculaceae bacterium]
MNVKFERIDNVNATLTVSFVEDDYKDEVKKQLNELGRTRPIKGFRPGHVPAAILQKMYGNQVLTQVIDNKVSREMSKYIVENKINVLGEPMLNKDTHVDLNNEKDFEFKFDLGIAPDFDVKLSKKIKVPYYNIQVSQEMIDNQNAEYRKRFGRQVPGEVVAEDSLVRGAMAELNEDGSIKEDGIKVERTVIMPRYLKDEEQKAKFIGAKLNDNVVFNPYKGADGNLTELSSMLNVDKENAEIHSDFQMQIEEILVNKDADLDQEFFDNVLGHDQAKDEGEYFDKLKQMLANQLKNDSNYRFTIDAEKVIKGVVGDLELPDEFLKRYLLARNENGDEKKIEEDYPHTKSQLQWQLIKEKIAHNLEVKIDADDKMRLARFLAAQQFAQYGMSNLPDDVIDNYARKLMEDERYSSDIENRAFEDKVFAAIKENVSLDEHDVTVDEFNKLFEKSE